MPNHFRHIIFVFCLFIFFVSWNSCSTETMRLEDFEVHGIDVSHYQKRIDWPEVAMQDIDFAFVKATEGETYKDSLFHHNWNQMESVGMMKGAYHFYIPSVDPMLQVENFTGSVEIKPGDLPPVLDFEKIGKKNRIELIADLQTWLKAVEYHYDIRPIIYTNQKLYNKYIKGNFDEYIVWIARYNTETPDMPFSQSWTFWQYGNRGRIDGIVGDVDFNVFHGDLEALKSITYSPTPDPNNLSFTNPYQL